MTPLTATKRQYERWKQSKYQSQIEREKLGASVRYAHSQGYSMARIADILEITPPAVFRIINEKKND